MPLPASLEVRDLSCYRGDSLLFEELSWSLGEGEALQIVGPNGSGKTSLLRILAGLLSQDEGHVFWKGVDIADARALYQGEMGYLGHHLGLKLDLTVSENMDWCLGLRGQALKEPFSERVLQELGVLEFWDRAVRRLSQGQRQRAALARMALMKTRLWILDEPFTALDMKAIGQVEEILERHLETGGLLVLTSHQALNLSTLRNLELR